jgi:hypothetical protein
MEKLTVTASASLIQMSLHSVISVNWAALTAIRFQLTTTMLKHSRPVRGQHGAPRRKRLLCAPGEDEIERENNFENLVPVCLWRHALG